MIKEKKWKEYKRKLEIIGVYRKITLWKWLKQNEKNIGKNGKKIGIWTVSKENSGNIRECSKPRSKKGYQHSFFIFWKNWRCASAGKRHFLEFAWTVL